VSKNYPSCLLHNPLTERDVVAILRFFFQNRNIATTLYIESAVRQTPPSDTIQKKSSIYKNKKPPAIIVVFRASNP